MLDISEFVEPTSAHFVTIHSIDFKGLINRSFAFCSVVLPLITQAAFDHTRRGLTGTKSTFASIQSARRN